MKLKQFVCKAASIAMCAMIIGTTVVSVNVKADTKATESTVALDTHDDDGVAGILEQDDFDTLEEYQKYLETHPKVQTRQSRVSANKNVKAAATLRYKIKGLTNTATHNNFGGNAESEGIQLKGDYVYFGISDKQSSDKACIYSIPKSAF